MTLKERFKQWLDTDPRVQIREVQLEVIADEFAIGFLVWSWEQLENDENDKYSLEQLLEIYKREKGL